MGGIVLILSILCMLRVIPGLRANKNKRILQLHKITGIMAMITSIFHLFETMPLWNMESAVMIISGIISAIMLVLLVVGYYFRRANWKKAHRVETVILIVGIIIHLIC
jgi:predicted ferric reductase